MANDDDVIQKTYSIFAGKLRRFHGKPWYWYISQPGLVLHNIKDAVQFILGFLQSVVILIFWRPQVVFVKGGFVGLPVGLAAALLRIPIITHDSDTAPGLTNRILSRYAHTLAVGAPIEQYPQYAQKNIVYTGVPVRSDFLKKIDEQSARTSIGIPETHQLIVVTGGSLGAVRLNNTLLTVLDSLLEHNQQRSIYWLTGSYGYSTIREAVQKKSYKEQVIVEKFSDAMPAILAAATIIISRAGATTIAEISALHKPTIIIPNPLLTGGHQLKNGRMLHQYEAAVVLEEHELQQKPELLAISIETLLNDSSLRDVYAKNLARLHQPKSAHMIAEIIINAGKRGDAI